MSDWEDKLEKKMDNGMENLVGSPKKTIVKWIFWVMLIGAVITVMSWGFNVIMAPVKGTQEVIQKTFDGDKIFADYEWFHQQYEDYQGICEKIRSAEISVKQFKEDAGPRKDWDYSDKDEMARLNSILSGLKFQKADIVKNYNARGEMITRNLFKSKNLPKTLN